LHTIFCLIFCPPQTTYAQKQDSGANPLTFWKRNRYKLHSACKSLICKDIKLCFFSGQFSQSLDFQGLGVAQDKI
jgi:hypothetical protein